MAAYLAEHVPHLQSLHTLLGLPPGALQADELKIEEAIREAVSALIRSREEEVDVWRVKIEAASRDLEGVRQAIGEVLAERRGHDVESIALPAQYAQLLDCRKGFEQRYTQRVEQIDAVRHQIDALADLLGLPVESTLPLQPIASSSKLPAGSKRRSSAKVRSRGSVANHHLVDGDSWPWLDVSDAVLQRFEHDLQRAVEERETRTQQLSDHYRDLMFFYVELALPPLPTSSAESTDFPPSLILDSVHDLWHQLGILQRYIELNAPHMHSAGEEEEATWSRGLEGVEPERGLMSWLEELVALWTAERDARIARIQEIYDKLEPMWLRLEVEQETMDLFIEMNRGCGQGVITAYEDELERCLELRRSSLSSFVLAARRELEELWDALMYSEEEKNDFGPFIDDDYTEELLLAHEEEAERLKLEMESKATLLPKVKEWHKLKLEEEELDRLASDPNRFSRRGGALLREEKLRKRVGVLLPKIENDILVLLPQWETENQRPFLVNGTSVVEQIYDEREAKEAAKEAKKRAKQGLAPTVLGPTKVIKATPMTKSAKRPPGSVMSSTMSKKREAPTSAGLTGGTGTKRQRVGMSGIKTSKPPVGRTASGRSKPADPSSSPTPAHGLRTVSGSSSGTESRIPSYGAKKVMPNMGRRESFKPRQSMGKGLLQKLRQNWEVLEEHEEVDIF